MLLDEPTQGMSAEDVGTVTDLIRRVVEGRTIVMVEHNLNVVSSLADTITVLNRGEVLAEGNYDTVSTNPDTSIFPDLWHVENNSTNLSLGN